MSDAGLEGDVIVVNGAAQPRFEVARRRYRFRLLNGSNARPYELALSSGNSFQLIATEGGLLEQPVTLTRLPIWPAERYEIVVDFAKEPLGSKVVLNNLAGSGSVAQVMRFDVTREATDDSSVPAILRPAAAQLDDTHLAPGPVAVTRLFKFQKTRDGIYVINGEIYDKNRIDAAPKVGETEVWVLENGWGWSHPVHIHLGLERSLSRRCMKLRGSIRSRSPWTQASRRSGDFSFGAPVKDTSCSRDSRP